MGKKYSQDITNSKISYDILSNLESTGRMYPSKISE